MTPTGEGIARPSEGGGRSRVARTKGQLEAEISNAVLKFEKEHMGRGPDDIRAFIVEDMVVVRERGVLTPAETHLAKSPEGRELIRQFRARLVENSRVLLSSLVRDITNMDVVALHSDVCTGSGERIFVFCLDGNLEVALGRSEMSSERGRGKLSRASDAAEGRRS